MKQTNTSLVYGLAMLFSGAALLISIYFHFSLAISLLFLGAAAGCSMKIVWANTTPDKKQAIKHRIIIGIIAGIFATTAYDIVRLILTAFGQLPVSPFETFNIFGKLIIGEHLPRLATLIIGTLYHYLNGITFAVSYTILLGGKHWWLGIVWALGLESLMLMVYPGWLDLDAVMKEFVALSLIGHIVYGGVLGWMSQKLLKKTY